MVIDGSDVACHGRPTPSYHSDTPRAGAPAAIAALVGAGLVMLGALGTPATTAIAAPGASSAGTSAVMVAAESGGSSAPQSIPVPDVARRADDAGKVLRDLDGLLVPGPAVETIRKRLPEIAARITAEVETTERQLDAHAAGPTLDGLTGRWRAARVELLRYVDTLAARATVLEGALRDLASLQQTWTATRTEARLSRAPAPVLERIDAVLVAIAASRARVQDERAAALVLQDEVARELARCDAMLGRIAGSRQAAPARLLEPDAAPLWQRGELARRLRELPAGLREAVATDLAQLRQFAQDQRRGIAFHVALFAGLVPLVRAARRRAHARAASADAPAAGLLVFERPVSAALLLALLASEWIYSPPPPRAAMALGGVLALAPALRLVRLAIDPPLVRGLYVLSAFFLVDIVRRLTSVVPALEQAIFLLEMLAGSAVLALWLAFRQRRAIRPAAAFSAAERVLRAGAGVALLAFAVAVLAEIAGYTSLALLLGSGVLASGYVALVLFAAVRVGDGLVAFALRERPLRGLGMVVRHRPLLERRGHGVLRWLAVGGWAVVTLRYLRLWSGMAAFADAALRAELRHGSLRVSLADVLVFALVVGAAFLLSALLRFLLEEDVYPRLRPGRILPRALSSLLHYAVLLTGFLVALAALGADLTKITILASALGVGIGFGLQNIVNNFVSGLVVLFERRIDVGDAVQLGDVAGRMQQMGIRACTVRTWEGAEVIVPNARLVSDTVTNWTPAKRLRRIDVPVGVAYGTAPERMLDLLRDVARAHPRVLRDPAPSALFLGFGESALRFELQAWTERFDLWLQTRTELNLALYAALRTAGIEVAIPQRELRLRHADRDSGWHAALEAED